MQSIKLLRKIKELIYIPLNDFFKRKRISKIRHEYTIGKIVNTDMESLKGKYKTKKCLIVGNGKSLNLEFLEQKKKEGFFLFFLNNCNKILQKISFEPDFLVIHDPIFLFGSRSRIDANIFFNYHSTKMYRNIFFERGMKKKVRGILNNVTYFDMCYNRNNNPVYGCFSEYPQIEVSDLGSVSSTAIQIACFLGFDEIYLIGQDLSYSHYIDRDGNRIDCEDNGFLGNEKQVVEYADVGKMLRGFDECQRYCSEKGIKIVNLTKGGKLDSFIRG